MKRHLGLGLGLMAFVIALGLYWLIHRNPKPTSNGPTSSPIAVVNGSKGSTRIATKVDPVAEDIKLNLQHDNPSANISSVECSGRQCQIRGRLTSAGEVYQTSKDPRYFQHAADLLANSEDVTFDVEGGGSVLYNQNVSLTDK